LSNGNTKHEQNRKQQANKDSPEWNLTNAGSENQTDQVFLRWVATKDKPEWNPTNAPCSKSLSLNLTAIPKQLRLTRLETQHGTVIETKKSAASQAAQHSTDTKTERDESIDHAV